MTRLPSEWRTLITAFARTPSGSVEPDYLTAVRRRLRAVGVRKASPAEDVAGALKVTERTNAMT